MTAATTTAPNTAVAAPRAATRRGIRGIVKAAVERINDRPRVSTNATPRMRWY